MGRVAVIGGGISGLAAAYLLSRRHEVTLYERDARLGGHTHTVDVETRSGRVRLDTGFLVHNDHTYPNLVRLFRELDVSTRPSDMSFSVSCRDIGLEYSSRGARGFFAQRRNLWRPAHLRLLGEILRFHREAPAVLAAGDDAVTVGALMESRRYAPEFVERYLLPMASAIWSASRDAIREFPAVSLLRFLDNHGLLRLRHQPTWKVVDGGSDVYVPKLVAPLADRVWRSADVQAVRRVGSRATVDVRGRPPETFDAVVFACHGDQVLPLLPDATPVERDVFGGFETTTNLVWLHTDASVLPRRPWAGASWNYLLHGDTGAPPSVTYDLNRLQGLQTRERYCVTLNPRTPIDEQRVLRRLVYRHPLYSRRTLRAQARWHEVSGVGPLHFCGAYWGHGFHEDGLTSAIRVGAALGVSW